VVDDECRRGSLLGVEQLLEHSPELMMSPLPESLGDLVLEVFDGRRCGVRVLAFRVVAGKWAANHGHHLLGTVS